MLDDELDKELVVLIEQWNIAERRIKKAEQVRANEVVASAIFELRYAGRKLVDAIHVTLSSNITVDKEARKKVHAFIADATEDCVKAKHDAIDSMLDFVTTWFDRVEKKLGLKHLQAYFPDYIKTTASIADMQDSIADSRGDRTKLRDRIYDEIEKAGYDAVLDLFRRMKISNDRITAEIRKENIKDRILWAITIISLIIGIPGCIDLLIKWLG